MALIQSLFEGTLYLFVLEWTPALSDASGALIPHGYIFASFMVSIMIGSTIFRLLSKHQRPESFMRFAFLFFLITVHLMLNYWLFFSFHTKFLSLLYSELLNILLFKC